jgi:transketolase
VPNSPADEQRINAIRFLAVDAVQKANSGHPGMPMGAAAMAYTLWTRHLRFNPKDPHWLNRDRFVLSAGHGSMLLYALLYLTGYDLTLDDIKNFRQLGSKTPGHPEAERTPGVEATTGPLGQGIANSVGMAIAEAHLGAVYDRDDAPVVDHFTYCICGDGDLMEGISQEALSLAGHLKLGKLIVFYDDNLVSLAGPTDVALSDDAVARFDASGWHTQLIDVAHGNDVATIDQAIEVAKNVTDRPSFIAVRTHIGYGSPRQDSNLAHGEALGPENVKKSKEELGWPLEPEFYVPDDVLAFYRETGAKGAQLEAQWQATYDEWKKANPDLAATLERALRGDVPPNLPWPQFTAENGSVATRDAGGTVMNAIALQLPELVGGSGDLDPSTFTWLKEDGDFESPSRPQGGVEGTVGGGWGYGGRNIHFGVREHAMGAAINGLVYHGGFIPFGATFLVFADYMRPPIRLSAIAQLRSIWVYTHDSIAVGEDGPTHEAVEQIASLRAIPGITVLRPCDANETRCAWQVAIENNGAPTVLVLSRQHVPTLDRKVLAPADGLRRGAYVLNPAEREPELILIGTGSEVSLLVGAEPILRQRGLRVRVVSMPSWELFEQQSADYRESVLPRAVKARLAVEAARSFGWERWVGSDGDVVSVDRFGASAPGGTVLKEYGFTVDNVVARALALVAP